MDIKTILTIYASVISTIVFLWRLYEFYDDKRGNFKVTLKYITEMPVFLNNQLGDSVVYLVTVITNKGKHKRLIERPALKVDVLKDGKDIFNVIDMCSQTNFPLSIEPGEKYEYKMRLEDLKKSFNEHGISKVRAILTDTLEKQYYSEWTSI